MAAAPNMIHVFELIAPVATGSQARNKKLGHKEIPLLGSGAACAAPVGGAATDRVSLILALAL